MSTGLILYIGNGSEVERIVQTVVTNCLGTATMFSLENW